MGEVLNLRQARKRKARAERDREAQENRVRHGLPGHEKRRQRSQRGLDETRLDGNRRDEPAADA